jgi:hypothetical protein
MLCPECQGKTKVFDSREIEGGTWRRRRCVTCGFSFTTAEQQCATIPGIRAGFRRADSPPPKKRQVVMPAVARVERPKRLRSPSAEPKGAKREDTEPAPRVTPARNRIEDMRNARLLDEL